MFFILNIITIFSAILMIGSINPINGVLSLIAILLSISTIFLLWNVEFLALIFIIIYVGAIAVLFLFIVMMINIKKIEKDNMTYLTIGSIFLIIFISQLSILLSNSFFNNNYLFFLNNYYIFGEINNIDESLRIYTLRDFGIILFSIRPILLLLSGFILLIAMIGSIYLTNEKRGFSMKKQFNQLSRIAIINHVNIY